MLAIPPTLSATPDELVPPGDMSGLAATWEQLLALPDRERRALGKRARARIAEQFEIGAVVNRYEAFYEELAGVNVKREA